MRIIKIGVLCPSEIAFRRFMPALSGNPLFKYVGIGVGTYKDFGIASREEAVPSELEKAKIFQNAYGGSIFTGYKAILKSNEIDAIYIPLPPGLHHRYAKLALLNGKHVFVEKPSTSNYHDSVDLVETAFSKGLALHENYMFNFHAQLDFIEELVKSGEIGDVRLYSIHFGFPFRGAQDFRYNKALGGGALLDCGGYTLKLADRLLGYKARIISSILNSKDGFDVDIFGTAMLVGENGIPAIASFGMDNEYKCDLEVWGSKGSLFTNRVLTAPTGFEPIVTICKGGVKEDRVLPSDDTFSKSLSYFHQCISDEKTRLESYEHIKKQAKLVSAFLEASNGN